MIEQPEFHGHPLLGVLLRQVTALLRTAPPARRGFESDAWFASYGHLVRTRRGRRHGVEWSHHCLDEEVALALATLGRSRREVAPMTSWIDPTEALEAVLLYLCDWRGGRLRGRVVLFDSYGDYLLVPREHRMCPPADSDLN